jgi:eukaryotic-like serine/threonine-protein kinase
MPIHGGDDYLAGLALIHTRESPDDRRSLWRQGLASLAAAAADQQPTPLEGIATDQLLASVRCALGSAMVDDLSFLSRPVAAAALFELAGALPPSPEKRELGRRVLVALHESDAATFVTLATALALSSPRALGGTQIKARVALSLRLPLSTGAHVDGLALALLSRPELERNWLSGHSVGALHSRRLAARLLERAAREAAKRAKEGDDSGVRVFERPSVRTAWARLITDRESLVWRHVAVARGLLSVAAPMRAAEIERDLSPRLGPSEWRRAATSLSATAAHDPDNALPACLKLAGSELQTRDNGIASSMIYGLSRVVEQEPEAADELLAKLVPCGGIDAIEALADLREEVAGHSVGQQAASVAIDRLRNNQGASDDGTVALIEALIEDLDVRAERPASLRFHLNQALHAFAAGSDLGPATEAALQVAGDAMDLLQGTPEDTATERKAAFRALRELDAGLLVTSVLSDLVVVRTGDLRSPGPLTGILWRLGSWLLVREHQTVTSETIPNLTLRFRQLRSLLHLVDSDIADTEEQNSEARGRRLHVFKLLAQRAQTDVPSPLRRLLCATLARAADALAREQVCELSDVFIAALWSLSGAPDLRALAEACMVPELKDTFAAAAQIPRVLAERGVQADEQTLVDNLRDVAEALPPGSSARVEGLRRGILSLVRVLDTLNEALSLTDLRKGDMSTAIDRLAGAITYAARLCAGAMRRTGLRETSFAPYSTRALRRLEAWIERALREHDEGIGAAATAAAEAVRQDLPPLFAEVVARVLRRIGRLPREPRPSGEITHITKRGRQLHLPSWLPPSRIIGGFFVVRPIGTGGGGSVFVARRSEERHEEGAETFAMKVPAYNGAAAHTLSEEEFMQLFREEAGTLLTLPRHTNIAGFVTFDAGARPKPILVMELVRGNTLEGLIDRRALSMSAVLDILDGVAAGLQAMHDVGLAHLDLKPANIILRTPRDNVAPRRPRSDTRQAPVLVDFGLAGRKVRPGCGSPYYGGPEVWDISSFGNRVDPRATDVYAYCCLAFELLTGNPLFAAETLPAIFAAHLSHDGNPPGLAWMREHQRHRPVGDLLSAGLIRTPERRLSIKALRECLLDLGHEGLADVTWPIRP